MTGEFLSPPPEAVSFNIKKEQLSEIKTTFTLEEKIEFYGLRDTLAQYCRANFSSREATVADMAQLFTANNCTLADLMVTALVLAGKVNRYETIDKITGEKTITIAAQEEDKKQKKLPHSVENLFQELLRLLQAKEKETATL